jgi:hypothetical protein
MVNSADPQTVLRALGSAGNGLHGKERSLQIRSLGGVMMTTHAAVAVTGLAVTGFAASTIAATGAAVVTAARADS